MATIVISENTGATYSGVSSNHIREQATTDNYGDSAAFEVQSFFTGQRTHALVSFTGLSNVSAGGTVSNSKFGLYITNADVPQQIAVRRLLRNWGEFTSSWNNYDTSLSWQTAGALGALDRDSTIVATFTPSSTNVYIEFTGTGLDAVIQGWIDGTFSNYGFELELTNDTFYNFNYNRFIGSSGSNGQRPYLTFDYSTGSITGTSATTNAADTSSATGTTTILATSATTNANDTSSASGTTTITGSSTTTNANDTANASGTTTVTGTSATTNADDTSNASGSAGTPTGTADCTNNPDTCNAQGETTASGDTHDFVPDFWYQQWNKKPKKTVAEAVAIVQEQVQEQIQQEVPAKLVKQQFASQPISQINLLGVIDKLIAYYEAQAAEKLAQDYAQELEEEQIILNYLYG